MHTKRSRMRNDGGGGGARECAQSGREKQVGATLRFKSAKHHTRCTNFPRYSAHSLCRCFSLLSLSLGSLFFLSRSFPNNDCLFFEWPWWVCVVVSLFSLCLPVITFSFRLYLYLSLFWPSLSLAYPHCLTNRQIWLSHSHACLISARTCVYFIAVFRFTARRLVKKKRSEGKEKNERENADIPEQELRKCV